MKWNSDVTNVEGEVIFNYDSVFDSRNLVDTLLCDPLRLDSENMFVDYYYFNRGENQDHVAGYAFDNIPIFNALIVNNYSDTEDSSFVCTSENCTDESDIEYRDAFARRYETMDSCLTHSNLDNKLHYLSMGGCMK